MNLSLCEPFFMYISSPFPVLGGFISGISIFGAFGDFILGVTGLKSIAFGNVGDISSGGVTLIAPLVTIRGLILAVTVNDTGFSGIVVLLANPYPFVFPLKLEDADLGSLPLLKYEYIGLFSATYLLNSLAPDSLVNTPS